MEAGSSTRVSVATEASRDQERRMHRRYPVKAAVRYQLKDKSGALIASGSGQTVNVSSGGILFESNNPLKLGAELEVAIDWPASLSKSAGLQLGTSAPG